MYVSCGIDEFFNLTDSIERFDLYQYLSLSSKVEGGSKWEALKVTGQGKSAGSLITPRSNPLMAPIGDNEILIAGGNTQDYKMLSNGFIVDCSEML